MLELFKYNKFKLRIIEEQIAERGTVYRCGTLIDLCTGPHVKDSGVIKVLKILNVSKQKKICFVKKDKVSIQCAFDFRVIWSYRKTIQSLIGLMALHFLEMKISSSGHLTKRRLPNVIIAKLAEAKIYSFSMNHRPVHVSFSQKVLTSTIRC